ncbi:MAG: hypothetical protein QGF59_06770, partial [Pirellulaceae bacterium]|nr:hypothetical protein [Pirellulaceae bacterium]
HGQSPYRVHVETTKITEPLDKEGFVDYVAYVNERAKRGVVSEKNAMAAASRLFHRDDYPEFYRELGSTMPSREDSLLGISDFIGELERKRLAKGEEKPAILAHSSRLRKQFETARLRPWSAAEFPMVLKLIARNEEQLNELAAAAALPSYYAPSLPHPSGRVALAILPLRLELVMSCRQLSARAMLRLKQEEFQGAFEDLLACNRWSKHLTNESMVIGHIAAWAISNTSHVGMDHLFRSPALELKQAEAFFAAHQQLGDYPSCSKCRREGDLFMQLDDAARVARRKLLCSSAGNGPLAKADESIAGRIAGRTESLARNWLIPVLADWDAVMTRVNSQFEHQARIAEARTYAETVALESAYGVAHQSDVFCYELRDAIDALLARRSPRRIATDWA